MLKKIGLMTFILSSALYAEENVIKLNESVISSQNFKTNVKNTAANISIITAKEIEEKGAKDLADALRMVPGIMAKNYYGDIAFDIGGYSSVHAQRNNIITLDGVKISSRDASNIPLASIERIEVIPNGGGILHGDGASGGVINILSKNIYAKKSDQKMNGKMNAEIGSESSYKYGIFTNVNVTKHFSFTVDYSKYKLNSWREHDKYGKLTSRYRTISLAGNWNSDHSALTVKYTRNEKQHADGFDLPENIYFKNRKQVLYSLREYFNSDDFYITYKASLGLKTELLTYANLYKSTVKDREKVKESEYHKSFFKTQIKQNYSKENYFIVGIDYFSDKSKPYLNGAAIGRNSEKKDFGIFAINELRFGKFSFAQGIRYNNANYKYYWRNLSPIPIDKRNQEGRQEYNNYAANLELKYDYSNTGMIYGKLSREFRTPLTREMYYTVNASKLKAQTQKTFELGIKDYIGNVFVSASAFYKKINGEIYYQGMMDPISGRTRFPYYNMGDTRRIGLQVLSEQYFDKITFTESISYLNHKIVDSDFASRKNKEIPMVPNWKAAFGVNYKPIEKLNLNADLVYYGKYFDSDDPENIRAKDKGNYTTVSVSANYKFENGLALTARVNNLFNRKYEDYVGYWDNSRQYSPAVGRNYSIGIDYIF
ncbi:TonB-dependent receptor [Fusobacterium necrophorum]|uniref:Ligand-gated channel n=2 Tax=Fusobacterium necrophorum TaxID=859 RepID=A0AB73BWV5_9FUSO|nr:TonB-dependent receptor [Fusobacterium necrophorum]AYZ74573.1 TonB-dependent receptor [Fusobacterium necrophorum]AZW09543.1 TonB-dependent receptor [Fusobacterium necrophorum subsp. necrophorum]KDE63710.1 ligand-gated channel [Fusobacterium necrophorum BL]KDE74704.1 ligand-gated channel [Fusobacterium necrophorum BFTR-2]SDB24155.1 iron complex outermembrane recepter protein [Fusobacterium necrophorum]